MTGLTSPRQVAPGRQHARPIERVRGTHDLLRDDLARLEATVGLLRGVAEQHGFQFIQPPVLEHTELFLRKSGGERVVQLYAFDHRGRNLALRPEFTASAVRVYIEHLQSEPLPVRLGYAGPVFRYEKPQAGRSRQFTDLGCELIGASGPVADAEMIVVAVKGLEAAGVERPRLVLGHIGVVIDFLSGLDIDQRAQDWLTWSMERIRKGANDAHDLPPHLARFENALDGSDDLPGIDDGESLDIDAVADILRQAGVRFDSGVRTAEEVVQGLFAKRRRRHDVELLREAAAFVTELTRLSGPPAEVLSPLRALVVRQGLDAGPLDELERIIELLAARGIDGSRVTIDLGMGRGLHYYTGMLFEAYGSEPRGPQLCGGGRYDDLAQVLGAREAVPACGFSYGVERVVSASTSPEVGRREPRALVLQNGNPEQAMFLADELRERGWIAVIDLRERNESATRRAASRQGFDVIVSADGDATRLFTVDTGEEATMSQPPSPAEVLRGQ